MPEPDQPINDLIGCVARTITWMQHALDQQVSQRRATREFAAAEMERMTLVLHLLEDLRAGADARAERQPKLHVSIALRRKRQLGERAP
jgi:hypothetical protein